MSDFSDEFKKRTKSFAILIIELSRSFPKTEEAFIIKKQLLRSAFSVASNYRAVCRARSDSEFYSKLCIVVEEADEVVYWLELVAEMGGEFAEIAVMHDEAEQILKIMNSIKAKLRNEVQSFKE